MLHFGAGVSKEVGADAGASGENGSKEEGADAAASGEGGSGDGANEEGRDADKRQKDVSIKVSQDLQVPNI
jgi:hypothetical protein